MTAPAVSDTELDSALDLATEALYRVLALALADPRVAVGPSLIDASARQLACEGAALLRQELGSAETPLGFGELPLAELDPAPALAELDRQGEALPAEYVRVFGLVPCRECPPYETEFHTIEDTFFRSQQMADIAGFYRAFGLTPRNTPCERPDYLPLELEFAALLLRKEREARSVAGDCERARVCREARKSFLADHVCWWAPSFAIALTHKAEYGPYAAWARVLAALLPLERRRLGIPAPCNPQHPTANCEPSNDCEGCLVDLKT